MTLLIHPGFHKTATSWLQEKVFGGSPAFAPLFTHEEIDRLLVRDHDLEFRPERVRDAIEQRMNERAKDGRTPVISSEILSGNPFDGSRDSLRLAERLHATYPSARILLTVRQPESFARSIYLQYLKRGGRMSAEHFFTRQPQAGYHWFRRECLQFGQLANRYADLFGTKSVMVLPQELLRADRSLYLEFLTRFATGAKSKPEMFPLAHETSGKSPPNAGIPLLRFGNLFYRQPMNPEALPPLWLGVAFHRLAYAWQLGEASAKRRLTKVVRDNVDIEQLESNEFLQRYCPVDLAEHGYILAK